MSSLVWHRASQSASGRVKARTPRKPFIPSACAISRLHRTDLLASLIGFRPALRVMSAAFERKAAMSMTAKGGSSSDVAALSLRRCSASAAVLGRRACGAVLTCAPPARRSLLLGCQRGVLGGRQQARRQLIARVKLDLK